MALVRRWLFLAGLAIGAMAPSAQAIPLGATVLLDRPSGFGSLPFDGIGNTFVNPGSLTADGRYVVFTSQSNALLSGDEDSAENVYRLDLTTGALVQVDTTASGGQPTPGSSNFSASISADGNHVGFYTNSPALDPAASPTTPQYVVKNLSSGVLESATRSTGQNGAPVSQLEFAVLSGDGRHVVFTARSAVQANNQTGVAGTTDAYERNLDTNVTHMVSVTSAGNEGGGVFDAPAIDYGGDAVAFVSSNALVSDDTDTGTDAYVHVVSGTEATLLASFSDVSQTQNADSANGVAIVGGPGEVYVGWVNGGVFMTPCQTSPSINICTTAASRVDSAAPGGSDSFGAFSVFFPATSNSSLPTHVYFDTRDGLSPSDTNDGTDLYEWLINGGPPALLSGGQANNSGVFGAAGTNDGAVVTYSTEATNLPGSDGAVEQAYVRRSGIDTNISQQPGHALRTDGAGSAGISQNHAVSSDGRRVAFTSTAPALGSQIGGRGPVSEVLVRDVATGQTLTASAASGNSGTTANDSSFQPSIDAAGDRVLFTSNATNLVPGDANGQPDVFMRDLKTGVTTLVDQTAGGGFPIKGASAGEISADGKKAVFVSQSPDIPGAPPDFTDHVYEVDLATGDVTLIDRDSSGAPANDSSAQPDIDADGRRVAFVGQGSNLGGGTRSIYLRDLTNPSHPTTVWISVPQSGLPAQDTAVSPSIDADGGRVAFTERASTFGFGMTGNQQVFVRDVAHKTTTLVSAGTGGGTGSFGASGASISGDGNRVAFSSDEQNLPGSVPNRSNVYVRDLGAGTTVLASTRNGSTSAGRFGAGGGSLSANGACVAFSSISDNLVSPSYGSDFSHAFLHALSSACPVSAPDRTPPVISHLTVNHKRFRLGASSTAISAGRAPRGTTFRFTLSENATTRITITKQIKGHRKTRHSACRAARRHQKRNCTRAIAIVTLIRAHTAKGANAVAFSGRFGRKHLTPGSYTATLTATDAAGNRSKPRSVSFTVVR
jgi:hypothetical protein